MEREQQIDATMNLHGTTIRYTLQIPESYTKNPSPTSLILALHFGGNPTTTYGKDFLNILIKPAFKGLNTFIVSPTIPEPGSWTSEVNETAVMALVDSLIKEYIIDEDRIVVTGFSLGAIGTWNLAANYPDYFSAAIPIAGIPERDIAESVTDVPIYVIHSHNDTVFPLEDVEELVNDLKSKGKDIQFNFIANLSHYDTEGYVPPLSETIVWLINIWKR